MWILKTKKGFSLIEVLCAFLIFSIIFLGVVKIMLNAIEIKRQNELMKTQSEVLYAIKYNIMYNLDYDNLLQIYDSNSRIISNNKLSMEFIKSKNIIDLFSSDIKPEVPYGNIDIEKGDVLKVNIKIINSEKNIKKNLNVIFYKGKNL